MECEGEMTDQSRGQEEKLDRRTYQEVVNLRGNPHVFFGYVTKFNDRAKAELNERRLSEVWLVVEITLRAVQSRKMKSSCSREPAE